MKNVVKSGIALVALVGQLAYGHAELSSTMPADKAVLAAAPKEVMLHFSDAVRLTALSLQKQGESKQSLGPLPAEASRNFMVTAPSVSEGQYTVSWRALSATDAHVMTGEFAFAVGAGGAPAQHSEQAQPEQSHSGHQQAR